MKRFKFEVWPTESRIVTQQFGVNAHYYSQFSLPGHEGIDLRAAEGSPIYAVAAGKVIRVNRNEKASNYGLHVKVSHADGYVTTYAHLSEIAVVNDDEIAAGADIGRAGNTGNAYGAHLHLGLQREGAKFRDYPHNIIDPTPFLLPLMGWATPAGGKLTGWMLEASLYRNVDLAQVHVDGAKLWLGKDRCHLVPGGTVVELSGTEQKQFVLVHVALAALGIIEDDEDGAELNTLPRPTTATVDGWAWRPNLEPKGSFALVNARGINLRREGTRNSDNIGFIVPGSTVELLDEKNKNYHKVRAHLSDFDGPIQLPTLPPLPTDLTELVDPDQEQPTAYLGWVYSDHLAKQGAYATVETAFGASLYAKPLPGQRRLAVVKGQALVSLAGSAEGKFEPVLVLPQDVLNMVSPLPEITMPNPLPDAIDEMTQSLPRPRHDTTPGWVLTADLQWGRVGRFGTSLRARPHRDAELLASASPFADTRILGKPRGEYTPVRIDDDDLTWRHDILQPFEEDEVTAPVEDNSDNDDSAEESESEAKQEPVKKDPPKWEPPKWQPPKKEDRPKSGPWPGADPSGPWHKQDWPEREPMLSKARIGLHASADPNISAAEIQTFAELRPGVIKLSSFHNPDAIRTLTRQHPKVDWIVRAFLEFGGRAVTPTQFVNWTLPDVRRTVDLLKDKPVIVELHNEPNLVREGLGTAWQDGNSFASWWLVVLNKYRAALPNVPFMYPGLSPGNDIQGVRKDHIHFLEASRRAVKAADCLGTHLYWSRTYSMQRTLGVLDDVITRFRNTSIWVTEASNNDRDVAANVKAYEYIKFWQELQKRQAVRGVTYYVASASNPDFAHEVWVGRGIAGVVGRR